LVREYPLSIGEGVSAQHWEGSATPAELGVGMPGIPGVWDEKLHYDWAEGPQNEGKPFKT